MEFPTIPFPTIPYSLFPIPYSLFPFHSHFPFRPTILEGLSRRQNATRKKTG